MSSSLFNLRTVDHQARSMGLSRQETGVGCHAPLQGIFPTQGSSPQLLVLLHWPGGFFTMSTTWEAHVANINH